MYSRVAISPGHEETHQFLSIVDEQYRPQAIGMEPHEWETVAARKGSSMFPGLGVIPWV